MRTASKVLLVLAFLSLVIIFGLKMQNNYEMEQYYLEKEQKAYHELALLEEGQQESNVTLEEDNINNNRI